MVSIPKRNVKLKRRIIVFSKIVVERRGGNLIYVRVVYSSSTSLSRGFMSTN